MLVFKVHNKLALDFMRGLDDKCVHAVITDPPYNIGYDDWDVISTNKNKAYGGSSKAQDKSSLFKRRGKPLNGWSSDDLKASQQYSEFIKAHASEMLRVLKPGGSCLVFTARRYTGTVQDAFESVGFTLADILCWDKCMAPFRAQRISEVLKRRGIQSKVKQRLGNLAPMWEPILWFRKPYKQGKTITDIFLSDGIGGFSTKLTGTSNILRFPASISDRKHPTEKPLKLMEALVDLVSARHQVILDPFIGSGTTAVACVNLRRSFLGSDSSQEYTEISKARVKQARLQHQNRIDK